MSIVKNTGLTAAGLKSEFFSRFDAMKPLWPELCTTIQSNKESEKYAFLGTVPPLREFGSGRLARGLFTETYDVANQKFECTLEVDRDEISDDQTGQIRIRISELAERAATHKDSEIARLLVNGHSAGFHAYDGKPFFAPDHSSGKSGSQSNILTPAAAVPATPTVAEIRAAIKSAIATLLSLKDDQGEPMNDDASGLMVLCPPTMYVDALEALQASIIGSTSNVLESAAAVKAFSRLTAPETFYVGKTNVSVRPFISQDREPIEFMAREQDSDDGFKREKFLYGVRARYRVTYGYWQRMLKATFTTP